MKSSYQRHHRFHRPGVQMMGEYVAVGADDIGTNEDAIRAAMVTFNSTKYPGVCKPSNFETLAKFKELQSQLNRYAMAKGFADRVSVDGDIGPSVVALIAKATAQSQVACSVIALQAVERTAVMKAFADAKGIPGTVAGPAPIKVSTIVDASGKETVAPPDWMMKILGRPVSSTEKIVLLALAGGIGYMLITPKKRKRK